MVGSWSGDRREGCAVGIFFEGYSLHDTSPSAGIWVVLSRFKILSDKGQEYWCSRALIEKDSHNLETKIATKKGEKSRNRLIPGKEGIFPLASPGWENSLCAYKPQRYLQVLPEFSTGSLGWTFSNPRTIAQLNPWSSMPQRRAETVLAWTFFRAGVIYCWLWLLKGVVSSWITDSELPCYFRKLINMRKVQNSSLGA